MMAYLRVPIYCTLFEKFYFHFTIHYTLNFRGLVGFRVKRSLQTCSLLCSRVSQEHAAIQVLQS